MSFACSEEDTSPPTDPENQLGVTELQRTVEQCSDGLPMQPGLMASSRTEKQLCWEGEAGEAGVHH